MKSKYVVYIVSFSLLLMGCGGQKLSVADGQMARGEYYEASKTYRKIYNSLTKKSDRELRGQIAYRLARCHHMLSQYARASVAYQNAMRYGVDDSLARLHLAQALHSQGKYAEAVKHYELYLEQAPADVIALNGLAGARNGASGIGKSRYVVKNFRIANSRRSDFCPMFIDRAAADVLYFASTAERSAGDSKSVITGMKNADIWVTKKNEHGQWIAPEPLQGEINSAWDEGAVSFSPDGSAMYFSRARQSRWHDTGVEICVSRRYEAQWGEPEVFVIGNDTVSSYAHPAVSPDGRWLYFASDRPGGLGGKDIWRVSLADSLRLPENLGERINTPGDEMFPFVRDDSTLYFSSDGLGGYGALDIYRADIAVTGEVRVTNMGTPINSASDDFGIVFGRGEAGFFSSNRGDSRGYDNIYSFELPDFKINISGRVLDRDDEPVPDAVIRIVGNDGSNRRLRARTDGSFVFPLNPGVSYVMMAAANGYLNSRQEFECGVAQEDAEYWIDFFLASIKKPVVVDNIFYDYDKAALRDESRLALDSLAQVLRDNPNVTIEMGSHTDRHGSDAYNADLSQRRARSVIDYLIGAGIEADRLTARGYGKSAPVVITKRLARAFTQFKEGDVLDEAFIDALPYEDQNLADQINRRTEFKVLSTDYEYY